MSRQPANELAAVARQEPLFRSLSENTREPGELADDLDVSRSTVDRRLADLEDRGYAEAVDGGYRLTLQGRLALAEYRRFAGVVEAVGAAAPLAAVLPADCELAIEALLGADVVVAGPSTPDSPVDRHLERVREADRVRSVSTAIGPEYVEVYHDRVMDGELEVEAAIARPVLREILANYRDRFEVGFDTDSVVLRALEDTPPFSVSLMDGEERWLGVTVYTDEGVGGYVDNDSPAAVEWGERLFERYWARADTLTGP